MRLPFLQWHTSYYSDKIFRINSKWDNLGAVCSQQIKIDPTVIPLTWGNEQGAVAYFLSYEIVLFREVCPHSHNQAFSHKKLKDKKVLLHKLTHVFTVPSIYEVKIKIFPILYLKEFVTLLYCCPFCWADPGTLF